MKTSLALIFLLCSYLTVLSQSILDSVTVNGLTANRSLDEYLNEIESSYPVKFYYIKDWINELQVSKDVDGMTLRETLDKLFLNSMMSYFELNQNTVILLMDPSHDILRNQIFSEAKREQKQIEKINIGSSTTNSTIKSVHLKGVIIDSKTKQPMHGVIIQIAGLPNRILTNDTGEFELDIPPGKQVLKFNYIGFEEKIVDLNVLGNGDITIELEELPTYLDEVIIQDNASRNIISSEIGLTQLNMRDLKRAPALLGEVDLIKQIQLLPGVSSVGEAASGFNVRGGSVDQNLILYDGLPLFNTSHVFGFFSAFNADAIRDTRFYKGGIPAEYGGRISSVLDIRSKEGEFDEWKFQGGIGLVSSNIFVSGPIVKEKSSIAISLRKTYSDWMLKLIPNDYLNFSNSSVSFYDGTIRYSQLINPKTKLQLSVYKSHDKFNLQKDSTFRWNTTLASLRFDYEIMKDISVGVTAGWGIYKYTLSETKRYSGFDLDYSIAYPTIKVDFLIEKLGQKFSVGFQKIFYNLNPGTLSPSSSDSNKSYIKMEDQHSSETSFYLSDQLRIGSKLNIDLGIRASNFQSIGPNNVYIYDPSQPKEISTIIDTLNFSDREKIKTYTNLEPRVGLRFELNSNASIKVGFNRLYQYLHLVTNSAAVTPVDIWQPSGYYFKPQKSDQISIGYFVTVKNDAYDLSLEVYQKETENNIDFKDGANLILNPQIETDLLQGTAKSYGAETQISKKKGRLHGSMSYTYSRSFVQFTSSFTENQINKGSQYPSNYDQPHIINLNWRYNLAKRVFFTGGFTYHTGRPTSIALTAFQIGNNTVSSFSDRNKYRIPDYHRLDLGLVVEGNYKRKKLLDGTWTFSLYNAYSRRNPYSIFFKEVRPGILRAYRLSIIGSVIPSISYSLKF